MAEREVNPEEPLLREEIGSKEADMGEITSCRTFLKEAVAENKRLWYLAAPAIFTSIAQYSLGAVTQVFAGHLTTLELDAVSTENMVVAGLAFGIMLGMGSALETLCGQAYGAKQFHMLGVYLQRSWIILLAMCLCLMPIYIFATPILRLFGQAEEIAVLAGRFSLYMIPQLFAYGANFPIQKFLQAQSKVMTMAWVSASALLLHLLLSWLFIVRLGLGLPGAAASLNISWWAVVLGQLAYILMGYCPGAWTGFSWAAFRDLAAFARLSIASAIMLCLEFWYYMFLVVLAGRLTNPEVAVAAISICVNLSGWEIMVFIGFNAAISVRISNELGAGRPRAAKFSILVVVVSSAIIGVFFMASVLSLRDVYGIPFTNSPVVARAVSNLAIVFSFTLLLNSVQPVLTGVAVGAGWQTLVAYVNVFCYYIVGLPLGFLLGSYFDLGIQGIWSGMISGVLLQTLILTGITLLTNWDKEAAAADFRDDASRAMTGALLVFCGISCFFLSFTDSFRDAKGNVRYGLATRRALWVIDGTAGPPPEEAKAYKIKFIDFLHAFMSLCVFAAVALFDRNVVSCFYPFPSRQTEEILRSLPVGIGVVSSMFFVVFPTARHGIGFPLSSK